MAALEQGNGYGSLIKTSTIYQTNPTKQKIPLKPILNSMNHHNTNNNNNNNNNNEVEWDLSHCFKILIGAGIGSLLEFYSFSLVAYFEAELKNAYFPQTNSSYYSIMEGFTLYGVAFVMRPFGGLLFGAIGDKYGRVYALRASLFTVIIPTVLLGLLPKYSLIGYWSTMLAFLCRLVQGLAVGGEMSSALVYIVEEAPQSIRGTMIGSLFAMSAGTYLSLIAYVIWDSTHSPSDSQWSWRLPFVMSALIGIFAIYVRRLLPMSFEFQDMQSNHYILSNPIATVLDKFKIETFLLFLVYASPPVIFYSVVVWLPAYITVYADSNDVYAYDAVLIQQAFMSIFCFVGGWLSDYYGMYTFLKYALPMTIVNTLVVYSLIGVIENVWILTFLQVLLSLDQFGAVACLIWAANWIVDPRIRNTMTGISYNLGQMIFVSSLFDVQTWLANFSKTYGPFLAAFYIAIIGILGLFAVVYAENYHKWPNHNLYVLMKQQMEKMNSNINMNDDNSDDISTDDDIDDSLYV